MPVLTTQDKFRWEQVGRLEMNMRRLVSDVLVEAYGAEAWEKGVPKDTQRRVTDSVREHQGRNINVVESIEERLEESDLGALYEIIRLSWKSAFGPLFQDNRPVFDIQSDVIFRMRNCLDHYRREVLPTGQEDPTLRPAFDTMLPLQLRIILRGLASRELTCVDVVDENGHTMDREDPPALSRRDYTQFVGRAAELEELLGQLAGSTPVIVVLGIGGVGKTATCVEAALRSYRAGLFDEVIYASAKRGYLLREQAALSSTPLSSLAELLMAILSILGKEYSADDKPTELKEKALVALGEQATLLLLDNFETMQDQAETATFFWQVPSTTKVLVSSRIPPPTGGRFLHLRELGKEDIRAIINNECAVKGKAGLIPVDNPAILNAVYEAIGGIPLAAKLLVGMMVVEWKALESALQAFRDRDKSNLVDFCFGEIYHKVLSEDAKTLLKSMSMTGPETSFAELEAACGLTGAKLNDALLALEMTSLVSRGTSVSGIDAYRMLPLTRAFARSKLLETPGLEKQVRRNLQEFARKAREFGPEASSPSAQEALRLANVARMRMKSGAVQEAVDQCKQALKVNDQVPLVYLMYGMAEEARGNFEESERILEAGHKLFPGDNHLTHKLAMVKSKLEKFEEASKLYRSILVLRPTSEGEIIQAEYALNGLATNLASWIRSLRQQGKYREIRRQAKEFLGLVDNEMKYPGSWPRETDLLIRVARYNLGRELSISGEHQEAEQSLLGAFIDRPQRPKEDIHNGSVFHALDINLQKWGPPGLEDKRRAYMKAAGLEGQADF